MSRNLAGLAKAPLHLHGIDVPRKAVVEAGWASLGELGLLTGEWRALAARALEPNVFYDPAFALAAAPVFGADVGAVVVRSARRLIGLFPARRERRYGVLSALTGWTHPYAPLGVPLVDRDDADAAITAFLDHADGLVLLPLLPREGAFAAALARTLARRGGQTEAFDAHARALLMPPDDRTGYIENALPGKKLKELRRQRRRLTEQGPVEFAPGMLDDFLTLEGSGWKGRAGTAAQDHDAIRQFMQSAIAALAAEGNARIDTLAQAGRPLATTITLRSGSSAWFWKIAHDEAFARASPGVQIALDLTAALLADETIARVDSCATADHPMIDHLWRERLALADLLIAPDARTVASFNIARRLEALRRAAFATAKRARAVLRGR